MWQGGFGFFERRVHKVRKARKIQTNAARWQKDKLRVCYESLRGSASVTVSRALFDYQAGLLSHMASFCRS